MSKWFSLLLLIVVGCSAQAEDAKTGEVDVEFKDVPQVVLDAAKKAIPRIQFTSAEKEIEDGGVVYDLEGTVDGKPYEIEVNAAGEVLEIEEDDDDENEEDD